MEFISVLTDPDQEIYDVYVVIGEKRFKTDTCVSAEYAAEAISEYLAAYKQGTLDSKENQPSYVKEKAMNFEEEQHEDYRMSHADHFYSMGYAQELRFPIGKIRPYPNHQTEHCFFCGNPYVVVQIKSKANPNGFYLCSSCQSALHEVTEEPIDKNTREAMNENHC